MKIKVWPIKIMKVKDLVPYKRNPRKITERAFDKLKDRIVSQGFRTPPCIDNDGILIAGNQRFRSLLDLGLGDLEVPVSTPPMKLTDEIRREIIAADNISWGSYDFDMLSADYDLEELYEYGFTKDDLAVYDKEPAKAEKENSKEQYKVEVEVKNESEQEEIYHELKGRGYKCKIFTI